MRLTHAGAHEVARRDQIGDLIVAGHEHPLPGGDGLVAPCGRADVPQRAVIRRAGQRGGDVTRADPAEHRRLQALPIRVALLDDAVDDRHDRRAPRVVRVRPGAGNGVQVRRERALLERRDDVDRGVEAQVVHDRAVEEALERLQGHGARLLIDADDRIVPPRLVGDLRRVQDGRAVGGQVEAVDAVPHPGHGERLAAGHGDAPDLALAVEGRMLG